MESLVHIAFSIDRSVLMREAHVEPETEDAVELDGLVKLAVGVGRPKAVYSVAFIESRAGDTATINGISFASRALSRNLQAVERVFPVIATCGQEMDAAFPAPGDMVKEFWWDLIKTELLVAAHNHLNDHLIRKFRLAKTVTMRPGSGDATLWPIEQQKELFALLGDVEGSIGVTLTPSFLMTPNKTTSGIVFQAEKDFRTCEVCHRVTCPSRQAPFSKELWEKLQHD